VVLLDIGDRNLTTLVGEELAELKTRLDLYEVIMAVDVRGLLRTLGYDPAQRRLAELGPPQKTKKINQRGRTLKITLSMLVQGSCGISRPFGDEKKLREYLRKGADTKFRRRLEADAKSLFALYQYGRLHGFVRLRWGFLDEGIPAPWVHRDEATLYNLKRQALECDVPMEVVVGSAPGWSDPWARVRRCYVKEEVDGWRSWLVGEDGISIDDDEVQSARLGVTIH